MKTKKTIASVPSRGEPIGTEYILSQIHWQFFVTIGLSGAKRMPLHRAVKIWNGFRGRLAKALKSEPKRMMWAVTLEWGKSKQNPHLHALISGLPRDASPTSTIEAMASIGHDMELRDVHAEAYVRGLNAAAYLLKELNSHSGLLRPDNDCWPMISGSIWRALRRHPNRR